MPTITEADLSPEQLKEQEEYRAHVQEISGITPEQIRELQEKGHAAHQAIKKFIEYSKELSKDCPEFWVTVAYGARAGIVDIKKQNVMSCTQGGIRFIEGFPPVTQSILKDITDDLTERRNSNPFAALLGALGN